MLEEMHEILDREAEARAKALDQWNSLAEDHCRLSSDNEYLRDTLALILPMAKGYAAANRVGSNQKYIEQAERILQDYSSKEPDTK